MVVELVQHTLDMNNIIALSARLCTSGDDVKSLMKNVREKDQKRLINILKESGHLSTFEHATITFLVEDVSRALLAQITRHRLASFSVQSQRYVKQSQFEYVIPNTVKCMGDKFVDTYTKQMETIQEWYNQWVSDGVPPEDARFVLPNAATTRIMVTMNVRELLHFFKLRCCNRAQWEIRELANEMLRICKEVSPVLFDGAGASCASGMCTEGRMSCQQK